MVGVCVGGGGGAKQARAAVKRPRDVLCPTVNKSLQASLLETLNIFSGHGIADVSPIICPDKYFKLC